ncbi:MAG: hypothetical protein ABSD73_02310 [Candidatus Bathyarchaeia archaeon]
MRKATWAFTMLAVAMILFVSMSFNARNVRADGNYTIQHVDHTISVLSNGYVLMNDTVKLSGQAPNSFLLGFPYAFGPYVLHCLVLDASNKSNTFPVSLSEPLEDHIGFYGIKVDFSKGAPQAFSVQILFSNALVEQNSQNATEFGVIFPTFPSLLTTVDTFNGSVVLPRNAVYLQATLSSLTYSQTNLTAFAYNSSTVVFNVANNEMQLFDVDQLNRGISVNEVGDIMGTDSYYITNKGTNAISSVNVLLPENASDVNAQDQFGRTAAQPTQTIANTSRYTITLPKAVDPTKSSLFTVTYSLPSGLYLEQQGGSNSFALNMIMFQDLDYYINRTAVTFVLPEGATLQSFENSLAGDSYGISKNVFQEGAVINTQGVISLDSFSVRIVYDYSPLWVGFRPTIWVLALAMVGCLAVVVVRRPKAPAPVAVPTAGLRVRPEYIRSFVESYEERMKIVSEIDSLDSKAQKGRLPRQRYKVQRRTLETRLNSLSRNLTEVKERMRSTGGHYASLMRELEVAETGMNEYEANVKTIEARHSRGELSLEAYRKLLGDYQRRKERSEAAIKGILLRLREEIR